VWTHFLKIANWRAEVASLYSVTGCPPIFPKIALSFRPPQSDPYGGGPLFGPEWSSSFPRAAKSPRYRQEFCKALFKVVPIAGLLFYPTKRSAVRCLDSMRKKHRIALDKTRLPLLR